MHVHGQFASAYRYRLAPKPLIPIESDAYITKSIVRSMQKYIQLNAAGMARRVKVDVETAIFCHCETAAHKPSHAIVQNPTFLRRSWLTSGRCSETGWSRLAGRAQRQGGIFRPESYTVADGMLDLFFASCSWHVVEIAFFVRVLQIDCWR